ncbi:SocA family protein [Novosphingobium sp. ERN07]|uniref:Panacea domain-containing protein n=1 Tax=Novosphingobium sp. ERN07 TaxID=2726187 RepID=UPI0014576488|nr:type II toxin-antitoxin system antitoxin SocA domain-containing protein [Novosphingobium sp. ERN07]NLR69837.1 SocA family protein [Novosphingobium sp. ERN07]
MTNLALQKLLYFAHGWFYAMYDKPLVKSKFEAWKYGPVQRVIYDQFKAFRDQPIRDVKATYIDPLTGESVYRPHNVESQHASMIELVLEQYAQYTANQLVEASHVEDGPWEYVWQQADDSIYPGMKIPDALILDHFRRITPVVTLH